MSMGFSSQMSSRCLAYFTSTEAAEIFAYRNSLEQLPWPAKSSMKLKACEAQMGLLGLCWAFKGFREFRF